jgi:MFS family permease
MADQPVRPRPAGWLNATVFGIGVASLCSDVGHEMATTAMPVLLASMVGGPAALGLIEGVADGLSSVAKLLSGHYSDRLRRRKPLAVVGYFVTAVGMASFALATAWWQVLLGRVFGWLGRGARSPVRKVLLTEATTPETYGRAFGFERSMDTAGAVIGPLLTIGLMALLAALGLTAREALIWVFALTFLPGVAATLAIVFLVHEREHTPSPHAGLWGGLRNLPADFVRYVSGVGIAGLGDYSKLLLILWATTAFKAICDPVWADALAMSYYVGYNLVYMFSCYVSGVLADRLPKNRVLAGGYLLAVIPAVALLLPLNPFVSFGLAFGFSGVYMGVWETVESTTAATLLPKEIRGSGFGLLESVNGLGDLISSALVGALWVYVSREAAMGFVIVTALVGATVIASLQPIGEPAA